VLLSHSPSHVRVERDAYEFEDDLILLELFLEINLCRLVDLEGLQSGFALGQLVEDDAGVRDGGHDGGLWFDQGYGRYLSDVFEVWKM
jgi:hypothetical protein